MKISAVLIVKNEEKNIVDCLDGLMFCNEIIVIDDYSTDNSFEILRKLSKENNNIKIYKRKLENDFSKQRQFGIDNSSFDWIFFVDCDERISTELSQEIKEKLTDSTTCGGFLIKRSDFLWGKELKYGETGSIRLMRLFNKNKGSLKGKVHEVWETTNEIEYLNNPIKHYPHPSISEFLKDINFYTTLRADELFKNKTKVNFLSIIIYPMGKFLLNFFIKFGFLDGIEGLIHAILMSFHSFLVRGKLWQMSHKSFYKF